MHAPSPIAVSAILILTSPSAGQALNGRLEADRGEFRLHLDEGRVLERGAWPEPASSRETASRKFRS